MAGGHSSKYIILHLRTETEANVQRNKEDGFYVYAALLCVRCVSHRTRRLCTPSCAATWRAGFPGGSRLPGQHVRVGTSLWSQDAVSLTSEVRDTLHPSALPLRPEDSEREPGGRGLWVLALATLTALLPSHACLSEQRWPSTPNIQRSRRCVSAVRIA